MYEFAITGASGFVGSALCDFLSRQNRKVLACVRADREMQLTDDTVAYRRIASITNELELSDVFTGVDCVVHLAGMAHRSGRTTLEEYAAVNVDGTRSVLRASIESGVKRLVFISTIKVNGEWTRPGECFQTSSPARPIDDYGRSKWQAEEIIMESVDRGEIEATIIRPVLVYGPYVRANFLRLLRWVASGIPIPMGVIQNRRSLVFIENLCDLIQTCASHERAAGELFFAADADPIATTDLIRALARYMGVNAKLISIPYPALRFAAKIVGKTEQLNRLTQSLVVDLSKNVELLGWRPPFSTEEGLRRTAEWFKSTRQAGRR